MDDNPRLTVKEEVVIIVVVASFTGLAIWSAVHLSFFH
jgi:hypothetical protein